MANLDGKKLKQVIDPTLAKAFTHPLRGHVWVTVCEKGIVSPNEIATELDIDVSDVSYHFRRLHRKNLIGLHHTEPRRGTDEHFYEPCAPALFFDEFDWMEIPAPIRSAFSADMLRRIIEDLIGALRAGSLDARDRHLSRTWMMVDERGWRELTRTLKRTLERFQAIQERSVDRCKKSSETPIPVEVILAGFETAASVSRRDGGETESL
jgi:hypothetical protein